ncbi:MAG: DUF2007 domain-containing protein [Verrucomicrobiota bacterium]
MKTCSYCGANYGDESTECPVDHTPLNDPPATKTGEVAESGPAGQHTMRYEFVPFSPAEQHLDWVTLIRCDKLASADVVTSRLNAEGIEVFLPEETLMQSVGLNVAFGYVRVQVAPEDYDKARAILETAAA